MRPSATAAHLDRVIAESWPAAVVDEADGWLRRRAAGVTRRANSVFTDGCPPELDEAIDDAERFYADHALPPVFLCTEAITPASVTQALLDRGYRPTAPTWVLVADAASVQSTASSTPWTTTPSTDPTDEWFDAYWADAHGARPASDRTVVRGVLLDPPHPRAFVVAETDDGEVAAVGQVVVVQGTGCLQCLVTVPAHRRRGAGRAVVEALLAEARTLHAARTVAAVMTDNAPSLALFETLGFERSHRYEYLVGK